MEAQKVNDAQREDIMKFHRKLLCEFNTQFSLNVGLHLDEEGGQSEQGKDYKDLSLSTGGLGQSAQDLDGGVGAAAGAAGASRVVALAQSARPWHAERALGSRDAAAGHLPSLQSTAGQWHSAIRNSTDRSSSLLLERARYLEGKHGALPLAAKDASGQNEQPVGSSQVGGHTSVQKRGRESRGRRGAEADRAEPQGRRAPPDDGNDMDIDGDDAEPNDQNKDPMIQTLYQDKFKDQDRQEDAQVPPEPPTEPGRDANLSVPDGQFDATGSALPACPSE